MIRGNASSQDLRHDTSSLPGGKKLIDENATLAGPRHWSNLAGVELPSETMVSILVDSFFSSVNWFMMVFHEDLFRQRYTEMLQQRHIKYQGTTFYWTWLLVVALGGHYAALKDPDDEMSPQYQQISQDLISVIETNFLRIVGCSTIESVQICVLLGSFIFYTRPTTGLGICGMGVKIAQVIGLHRESFWKETCQLAREKKRRTWWTLEVFDKYAAVAFGRPCIIDDSDCQVEMVSDIELSGVTHVPAQPLILYHQHKFRLYRIMGAFLGRKRQPKTFESIDTIHQRMLQWKRDLPENLTLRSQLSADPNEVEPTKIHAMSLQLTYDNLQIILHRTAVFNNLDEIYDSLTNRSTSLQQIFTSAMDTSELSQHPRILDACRRTHADIHVGITIFTAGVVLCAICLSQPLTEMGSRAKTGVMHITRMCRQTTTSGVYSGQLVAEQSLGIIDSLVEVILQQENGLITGRKGYRGLSNSQTMQNAARSDQSSSSAGGLTGSSTGSTTLLDPNASMGDRVLESIQEVFRQHISTQGNTKILSADTSNDATSTFNWDGDMSVLVAQGLVDASQMWLWADGLDFDSFSNIS
ncbi:hypothetical protein FPOAC2_04270 [Fusarium poae]